MKKQLLVLIFACSAIGSVYSGDGDKSVSLFSNLHQGCENFSTNYPRAIFMLRSLVHGGLSVGSAYLSYKNWANTGAVTLGYGKWQVNQSQLLALTSSMFGLNALGSAYHAYYHPSAMTKAGK